MGKSGKRKKAFMEDEPDSTPARGHFIVRVTMTTLIMAAVVYVGLFLVFRTNGFLSYVEEKLSERLNMAIRVRKVSSDLRLNILIYGVASEGGERKGEPGFMAEKVKIIWSLAGLVRPGRHAMSGIEMEKGRLSMAPGDAGEWEPAVLGDLSSRLAKWGGFDSQKKTAPRPAGSIVVTNAANGETGTGLTAGGSDAFEDVRVKITGGSIVWWDGQGKDLARIDGLHLSRTPVALPNRRLVHYIMGFDKALVVDGGRQFNRLNVELLVTEKRTMVLDFSTDWKPGSHSGRGLKKSVSEKTESRSPEQDLMSLTETEDTSERLATFLRESTGEARPK